MRRNTFERFTLARKAANRAHLELIESGQSRGERRYFHLSDKDGKLLLETPDLGRVEAKIAAVRIGERPRQRLSKESLELLAATDTKACSIDDLALVTEQPIAKIRDRVAVLVQRGHIVNLRAGSTREPGLYKSGSPTLAFPDLRSLWK